MPLFKDWCASEKEEDGRKRYWTLTEQARGRAKIEVARAETIRSHYDRLAADVERLGYKKAAKILSAELPKAAKAKFLRP